MSSCPGTKGKNTYVSGRTKALYKAGAVRASSRLVVAGEEKKENKMKDKYFTNCCAQRGRVEKKDIST